MICNDCGNKFVRTPKHKHQRGVHIQSRAKLCPKCREKARYERNR